MQSPNNDLLYRLELGNGPNPFHLDQTTGLLTVQNSLDAETLPGLNYTVRHHSQSEQHMHVQFSLPLSSADGGGGGQRISSDE